MGTGEFSLLDTTKQNPIPDLLLDQYSDAGDNLTKLAFNFIWL
uniref:Uncharacterized protein n=1 Tax=Nelumbo nucifera TaxID=4432 RepID=A0A822YWU8_NELNU|nr:TPA_asm: hypothetical protein HUJ06_006641 [Nelumbo nucifera]